MSDNFQKFGEAARLYAKYMAVVDEMRDLFKEDTTAFFNALRDRVKSQVRTGQMEEEVMNLSRAWYIEDNDTKEGEDVPFVWFRTQEAEIVTPGVLVLLVYADGSLKPHHQQLLAMLSEIKLPSTCQKAPGGGGQLLSVTITYAEHDDPVEIAAEPVLTLLTELYDAWKKLKATIIESHPNRISKKAK